MPLYTFGDTQIEAPDRTTAVHIYNSRQVLSNQAILQQLQDQGVNIISGTEEPSGGSLGPGVPQRTVKMANASALKAKADAERAARKAARDAREAQRKAERDQAQRDRQAAKLLKQSVQSGDTSFASRANQLATGQGADDPTHSVTQRAVIEMLAGNDTVMTDSKGKPFLGPDGKPVTKGMLQTNRVTGGGIDSTLVGAPGDPNYQAVSTGNDYVTVNQALGDMLRADPEVIADWQDKLSAAGFFGFDKDGNPKQAFIRGVADDFTLKGFGDFLDYAVGRGGFRAPDTRQPYQAATGKDWNALLEERVAGVQDELAKQARGVGDGGGGGGGGGGGAGIQMPDPLAIKALANQISQALLGRVLTEEEANNIVGTVNAGAVASDAVNQDYDVEANIAEFLKRGQGTGAESQAHDLVNTYSTFTDLIGPMQSAAQRGDKIPGVTVT